MLRLLIQLSDPVIRERASKLATLDPDIVTTRTSETADLVLVDRDGDITSRAEKPGQPGGEPRKPVRIYVATDESEDERVALLGRGCLAVVDANASEPDFLQAVIGTICRWRKASRDRSEGRARRELHTIGDFVTASPAMKKFVETARRVSASDTSVLILGETGVGKERLAASIHAEGRRRDGAMVVVNCGAIPESLLESELFGHEQGAFTGAERLHRGYFERAHGGTIFLDEIGELPLQLQVSLLRVLQEREVKRVGGELSISVDVRVIAATNRDLLLEMEERRFRSDLFYRLSVVTLEIPPLRERVEDIPLLADIYLGRFRDEIGAPVSRISNEAMCALETYHWPGNVRELMNVMERAVLLSLTDEITLEDLPYSIAETFVPQAVKQLTHEIAEPLAELDPEWFRLPLREARHAWNAVFEKQYLEHALREVHGRVGAAATRLGLDPRSLYAKMKRYGLRKEEFRRRDA